MNPGLIDQVPYDSIKHIIEYLPLVDICLFQFVCKAGRVLAQRVLSAHPRFIGSRPKHFALNRQTTSLTHVFTEDGLYKLFGLDLSESEIMERISVLNRYRTFVGTLSGILNRKRLLESALVFDNEKLLDTLTFNWTNHAQTVLEYCKITFLGSSYKLLTKGKTWAWPSMSLDQVVSGLCLGENLYLVKKFLTATDDRYAEEVITHAFTLSSNPFLRCCVQMFYNVEADGQMPDLVNKNIHEQAWSSIHWVDSLVYAIRLGDMTRVNAVWPLLKYATGIQARDEKHGWRLSKAFLEGLLKPDQRDALTAFILQHNIILTARSCLLTGQEDIMELGLQAFGDPTHIDGLFAFISMYATDSILAMVFRLVDLNENSARYFCFGHIPNLLQQNGIPIGTYHIMGKIITHFDDSDERIHLNALAHVVNLTRTYCILNALHARRRKGKPFFIYNDKTGRKLDLIELLVDTGGNILSHRGTDRLSVFYDPDKEDEDDYVYEWD